MFSLLKITSTSPNDTILNNNKSILEVNYDSKIGSIEIGADEKKMYGHNSKDLSQEGEQKATELLELHSSERTTCFRII